MLKSLNTSFDHHHRNNEDRKDGVSYENLAKKYKLSKLGIYYLCKKYEMTGSIANKRGRDRKPKTSTREDSKNVRFPQKKNDISSREIVKDLKLNVSTLTVYLIIKNSVLTSCIQKETMHLKT
ncbi:hypothetical protein AVEN_136193-1 [Araneus ventricosus]|uniref:Uncharacterized protein n=1 Tax=Araneus ventricosus TaxID=182803 RepID=A0A4Y2MFL7_ARAVE|nr:hypothetical protein AVEN_136193-1 [Araneus ventricosus]